MRENKFGVILEGWDARRHKIFHEIVAPHVIEKMNHPLSYWSFSKKAGLLLKRNMRSSKKNLKQKADLRG